MATSRRSLLSGTVGAAGALALSCLRRAGAQTQRLSEAEQKQKIEAALPAQAFVKPRERRRLLIFDLNVNYGGHASIPTANQAFTLMGAKTGAFETEVSKDPAVFAPDNLKRFDAVFFNNTVGNCFEDPALRQSLIEFVYSGGGLMGVHGTSVAFTKWPGAIEDWPEFGIMLGGRGANHKANDEHVFLKVEDPGHPITQPFGGDFDYRDEFFRVHEPYSRNRVRVLLSIDTAKTDMKQTPSLGKVERADNDYALAWVRQYGRGRVFYCGFAHHPSVFRDPKMLQFYLAATQFCLGDLDAPTTPSAKLTPAIRAQEKLGWRLGLVPYPVLPPPPLFATIGQAAVLGLSYVGARSSQKVGDDLRKNFDEQLSNEEMRQIRLSLDQAGVRLLTYRVDRMPSDEDGWRKILAFAKKMGIEALDIQRPMQLPSFPPPTSRAASGGAVVSLGSGAPLDGRGLQVLEQLCDWHGIRLVRDRTPDRALGRPEDILINKEIVQLDALGGKQEAMSYLLERMHQEGCKPMMFSLEFPSTASAATETLPLTVAAFNQKTLQLANGGKS
ncbi:MAG: ThuA domain-containing protein [Planctomycetes bacterium]|nr:ThuA domain-containing protein [Planctomycetota bacterium]